MLKYRKIYFGELQDACEALIDMRSFFKSLKIRYCIMYLKSLCFVLISLIALAYLNIFIPNKPELFGIMIVTIIATYIGTFKVRYLFHNIELNIELFMMYLTVLAHEHNNDSDTYRLKNEYYNCIDEYIHIMEEFEPDFIALIPVFSKEEEA